VPKPLAKPNVAPLVVQPIGAVRVRKGDTVYAISRRHRVAVREIIVLNRLKPPYKLAVGQVLRLPTGRFHTVRPGDTVYGVSRRHGVDMNALVRANRIPPPYRLQIGQRLRLPPRNRAVAAVTGASIAPEQKVTATVVAVRAVAPEPPPSVRDSLPAKPPKRTGGKFLWPVDGKIISSFGAKTGGTHNDGINIAVAPGSPVRAAENGVVAYAGNELRGYCELLLIRHADGWMTAYAHNDRLLVRRGDLVKRGQVISRSGNTGNVTKPQAHFEIRRGGKALNPLKHLASR
jgi:murein DD-endopeptidase MepM/ murein hydrolase activator NlpD